MPFAPLSTSPSISSAGLPPKALSSAPPSSLAQLTAFALAKISTKPKRSACKLACPPVSKSALLLMVIVLIWKISAEASRSSMGIALPAIPSLRASISYASRLNSVSVPADRFKSPCATITAPTPMLIVLVGLIFTSALLMVADTAP